MGSPDKTDFTVFLGIYPIFMKLTGTMPEVKIHGNNTILQHFKDIKHIFQPKFPS